MQLRSGKRKGQAEDFEPKKYARSASRRKYNEKYRSGLMNVRDPKIYAELVRVGGPMDLVCMRAFALFLEDHLNAIKAKTCYSIIVKYQFGEEIFTYESKKALKIATVFLINNHFTADNNEDHSDENIVTDDCMLVALKHHIPEIRSLSNKELRQQIADRIMQTPAIKETILNGSHVPKLKSGLFGGGRRSNQKRSKKSKRTDGPSSLSNTPSSSRKKNSPCPTNQVESKYEFDELGKDIKLGALLKQRKDQLTKAYKNAKKEVQCILASSKSMPDYEKNPEQKEVYDNIIQLFEDILYLTERDPKLEVPSEKRKLGKKQKACERLSTILAVYKNDETKISTGIKKLIEQIIDSEEEERNKEPEVSIEKRKHELQEAYEEACKRLHCILYGYKMYAAKAYQNNTSLKDVYGDIIKLMKKESEFRLEGIRLLDDSFRFVTKKSKDENTKEKILMHDISCEYQNANEIDDISSKPTMYVFDYGRFYEEEVWFPVEWKKDLEIQLQLKDKPKKVFKFRIEINYDNPLSDSKSANQQGRAGPAEPHIGYSCKHLPSNEKQQKIKFKEIKGHILLQTIKREVQGRRKENEISGPKSYQQIKDGDFILQDNWISTRNWDIYEKKGNMRIKFLKMEENKLGLTLEEIVQSIVTKRKNLEAVFYVDDPYQRGKIINFLSEFPEMQEMQGENTTKNQEEVIEMADHLFEKYVTEESSKNTMRDCEKFFAKEPSFFMVFRRNVDSSENRVYVFKLYAIESRRESQNFQNSEIPEITAKFLVFDVHPQWEMIGF